MFWVCVFDCNHVAVQWFFCRGEDTIEEAGAPFGSREAGEEGCWYPSICVVRESASWDLGSLM